MNILNEKKGFTLIELLAVIVILAIVTVIGATTILPYIQNAGRDAFSDEANYVVEAASNAVSLIQIGSVTTNYTEVKSGTTVTGYCFTLKNLVDLGLWNKDATVVSDTAATNKYSGKVKVMKSGSAYTYQLNMTDGKKFLATKAIDGAISVSESTTTTNICS